ncbi:GNAT family N-acetyltransferase [Olivibacter sitiensis]|uniref:GNAT family N-acetyltransferase n=1 Tax=Olivibacter sitiensis TaxID=376470 RepID=UPI0004273204|nr:GNAT family N-acetyltransferase [Olivibacter sitiensis]
MTVRKAVPKDAEWIATYILLAMKDIVYKFIGEKDENKAKEFMLYFTKRKNNQYSYENCWVAEDENKVVAAAILYDGAELSELREPVLHYIKHQFNRDLDLEDETQPGEYYIDSLGVNPDQQGKGIGSKILRFLIEEYVNKDRQTLGLLVDDDNPNAKKLYQNLGFQLVEKKAFAGKTMEHLQIR